MRKCMQNGLWAGRWNMGGIQIMGGIWIMPGLHRLVFLLWIQNPQWYNFQGLFSMSKWKPKQEIKNKLPLIFSFFFFLAVREQHDIFPLANSSSPHHLEYVWVRDAWTPCVKSADNGCEERTFPFGRAMHATQRRVLCGLGQRLPKTLPTCASQGPMATVFHHQGNVATSRNP